MTEQPTTLGDTGARKAQSGPPGSLPAGSRVLDVVRRGVRLAPFTTVVVALILVLGVATGALWSRIDQRSWFPDIAFGVPALREGKWWTPVSSWLFGLTPSQYIAITVVFAVVVGWCEWRLGTRRIMAVTVIGQLAGELGGAALIWVMSQTSWEWAQGVATTRDVGITTAIIAAVAAASATLRSPWRLRVRAVLSAYVALSFLFEGTFADVTHLVALVIFLPVGERWFSGSERGVLARTRQEIRMLAAIGLVLIAVVDVVVFLYPGNSPFGPTESAGGSWLSTLVTVVIIAAIADQLRRGRRWAWWVAVVLGSVTVLVTAAALVLVIVTDDAVVTGVTFGLGLLWLVELALLGVGRHAFTVGRRRRIHGGALDGRDARDSARELLMAYGGSTMSWMTTWEGNSYWFGAEGDSVVTYQRHAGTLVVLADPVCPPGRLPAVVNEFTRTAERNGLTPCLFSVTEATADAARSRGWRTLQIAEDTILDLGTLAFKGKAWQDIRSAVNKAKKEQISFRLVTLADEPFAVLAQVRAISEEWVGDKGLPEMGFTLGSVEEALDPEVRVALAVDTEGSVHGVLSWLPVRGPEGSIRGWTLDVMRRRTEGFRPVIEFLIASSALAFQEQGAQILSLSGAPLARAVDAPDAARTDRLLDVLGSAMEPLYGFRSLHSFKMKFQPRYEPVYLCFREEADLPRIGIALTRAYLPTAGAVDLLRLARA